MELDSLSQLVYAFKMRFPLEINASDQLKVDIHLHEFFLGGRKRQCWTYITTGLKKLDQKEMCLSLLLENDDQPEAFPKTPIKIFQLLERHAHEGTLVEITDATRLGKTGLFGFTALYYLPAIQYDGLPNLDDHLALVLVHQAEYEFAKQYGFTRLISRIGKFCSSFPYPTWNTRKRPSLFETNHKEESVLNQLQIVDFKECRVELVDSLVTITLHRSDSRRFLLSLDELANTGKSFVLQSSLSLDASAILFWEPGQKSPGAYTALGEATKTSATFVAFSPAAYPLGNIVEDGFSFSISKRLIEIIQGHCEKLSDSGCLELTGFNLSIQWCDDNHKLLQPSLAYQHLAGWTEVGGSPEKIALHSVLEVTPGANDQVEESDLSKYINSIRQYLSMTMPEETEKFNLTIRTKINGASTRYQLSADIDLNPEFTKFVLQGLTRINPCPVSNPLTFDITFTINV